MSSSDSEEALEMSTGMNSELNSFDTDPPSESSFFEDDLPLKEE